MKLIMENWRRFVNEDIGPSFYFGDDKGPDWKKFRKKLDNFSEHVWVFFDTETTGLKTELPHVQATQVAAVAYNTHGFYKMPEEIPDGQFNMKLGLEPETLEFMEAEPEAYPEGEKTIKDLLKMSQYDYSEEAMAGYSDQSEVSREFTDYLYRMKEASPSGKIIMIAHNSPFDVKVLNAMYKRGEIDIPPASVMDSLGIIDTYFKSIMSKLLYGDDSDATSQEKHLVQALTAISRKGNDYIASRLGILAGAFDISNNNWHEALADVRMMMEVLYNVVQYMDKRGVSYGKDKTPSSRYKKHSKRRRN